MYKSLLNKLTAWVITSATAITFTGLPAKAVQGVIVAGTTNNVAQHA
jgi:hypothetical protein